MMGQLRLCVAWSIEGDGVNNLCIMRCIGNIYTKYTMRLHHICNILVQNEYKFH